MIPSGAESFHGGLFGGETCGVAFDAIGFGIAIPHLARRENAFEEARAEPFDRVFDPGNFGDIDSSADDHRGILQEPHCLTELLDAAKSCGDQRVLLEEDCSQVEEDPAFLDASDNGRIGVTKSGAQFIRAEGFAHQCQQMSGQDR